MHSGLTRLAALMLAVLLGATGCGSTTTSERAADTETLDPVLVVSQIATTTTTTARPVEETRPPLPVPEPLPLEAHNGQPVEQLGRLLIPTLDVDEPLHVGMTLTAINQGPSHWPGTAAPGQLGNMVIAGHRTTWSRPFHDLDLIAPGDEMIVETDGGRFTYVATGTEIVGDDALWIADQDYAFTATTFACHPKGSSRQRIVVSWQLVDEDGIAVPGL